MTLDSLQFRADFDASSMGVITRMLSTLYANPSRSVLREYIANGIDAHRASGVELPVEVTLPSEISPSLTIRDFGEGLSLERLQDTFFRYAASTKGDDNTQIGALGIGAKSAFALSKSWTVTSIHGGRRFVIVSADDSDDTPLQTVIINGEPTDQPSGIMVTIPISCQHMSHDWIASAKEMVYWFPKNSVKFAYTEGSDKELSSTGWPVRSSHEDFIYNTTFDPLLARHELTAVMGGIPYTVDSRTRDTVLSKVRSRISDFTDGYDHLGRHTNGHLTSIIRSGVAEDPSRLSPLVVTAARILVLQNVVDRFTNAAIDVPPGSIEFMDSRESVKGTPTTINSLVETIVGFLVKINDSIKQSYARGNIIEDLPLVAVLTKATSNYGGLITYILFACGVVDLPCGIAKVAKDKFTTHDILRGWRTPRVLVTGKQSSSALRKAHNMSGYYGVQFFYTEGDGTVDGFGDLKPAFKSTGRENDALPSNKGIPSVISYENYLERVRELFPSEPRDRDLERYSVFPDSDNHQGVARFVSNEKDTRAALSNPSRTVYAVKDVDYALLRTCSALGMTFTVIKLGRRKREALEKVLNREILDGESLKGIAATKSAYASIAALAEYNLEDIRAVMRCHSVSLSYERMLRDIVASEFGTQELTGTVVTEFLDSISAGSKIRQSNTAMFRSVVLAHGRLQELPERVEGFDEIAGALNVSSCPWPLLSWSTDMKDAVTMRHAVEYLKHATI